MYHFDIDLVNTHPDPIHVYLEVSPFNFAETYLHLNRDWIGFLKYNPKLASLETNSTEFKHLCKHTYGNAEVPFKSELITADYYYSRSA